MVATSPLMLPLNSVLLGFEAALPGSGQRRDDSVPSYTSLQVSDYDPGEVDKRLSGDGTPYLNQQRHFGKSATRGYGHISLMSVAFLPSLGQSPGKECKQRDNRSFDLAR